MIDSDHLLAKQVAKLTAMCAVDYTWRAAEDARYSASIWCSNGGQAVGFGPDEWSAVQAAHAIKAQWDSPSEQDELIDQLTQVLGEGSDLLTKTIQAIKEKS